MDDKGERPTRIRHKALFGGVFGRNGKYMLTTIPVVDRGLDGVRYMVFEPGAGTVLAAAFDKARALQDARQVLKRTQPVVQGKLWSEDELPTPEPEKRFKSVSRRRKDVFERSKGLCFYCSKQLTLDGDWEIEHQRPKAMNGSDDLLNLVAACFPCNRSKSDSTALEFIAQQVRYDDEP